MSAFMSSLTGSGPRQDPMGMLARCLVKSKVNQAEIGNNLRQFFRRSRSRGKCRIVDGSWSVPGSSAQAVGHASSLGSKGDSPRQARPLASIGRRKSALPKFFQFREVPQAVVLETEAGDTRVGLVERPFAEVAVLEYAPSLEVVLAHHAVPAPGDVQGFDRPRRHRVLLAKPVPGEAEGVLVAMGVAIPGRDVL